MSTVKKVVLFNQYWSNSTVKWLGVQHSTHCYEYTLDKFSAVNDFSESSFMKK